MAKFESGFFNCSTIKEVRRGIRTGDYFVSTNPNGGFEDHLAKVLKGFDFDINQGHYSPYAYFYSPNVEYHCHPDFNGDNKTVSYFENQTKKDKNIRTVSKIGRFLKKYCLPVDDKLIEFAVDIICEDNSTADYEVFVGTSREDFKKIYLSKVASGGNLADYKCINASCMRYQFHDGRFHPSEIYASGDFEIVALVGEGEVVYARAIVCTHDNTYLPIYTCNSAFGDKLLKEIKELYPDVKEALETEEATLGAKLLKIVVEEDEEERKIGYLTTYFDVEGYVVDKGTHFEISQDEECFHFSEADGIYFIDNPVFCKHCDRSSSYYYVTNNLVCEVCGEIDGLTGEYEVGEMTFFLRKSFWENTFVVETTTRKELLNEFCGYYVFGISNYCMTEEEFRKKVEISMNHEKCLVEEVKEEAA